MISSVHKMDAKLLLRCFAPKGFIHILTFFVRFADKLSKNKMPNKHKPFIMFMHYWVNISFSVCNADPYGTGIDFSHNIRIQMNRKELTKTFMMILNRKNPFISMVYTKKNQRFN